MKFKSKHFLILILIISFFLRFYKLSSVPPSPYWDETSLGYDAYSILKTGRDHHGNFMPLVAFESFGDYKPGLYIYYTVPAVAIFGLNVFAIRFASTFFGSLTPLFLYFLVKQLNLSNSKNKNVAPLLSAFFLSILPWHILVSRVGFECNLALAIYTLAVTFFLKSINTKNKSFLWMLASTFCFAQTMYAYHSYKILVPLTGLGLGLIYFNKLKLKSKLILLGIISIIIFVSPILINMKNSKVNHRFAETSAFVFLDPIIKSNEGKDKMGNTLLARIIHHRYRYFAEIFIKNYFIHFSPEFLFISGEDNLRHSTGNNGQLYWIMFPLTILGVYYCIKNKNNSALSIFLILLISPIPAAITWSVPHALRSLSTILSMSILASCGLYYLINNNQKTKIFTYITIIIISLLFFELNKFYQYYIHIYTAKTATTWWQYGYKSMIDFVNQNKSNYDQILVTRANGRPAMYYWFYSKTNPILVQQWDNISPKDQGEFLQFQNIYFGESLEKEGKQLIVSTTPQAFEPIKQINDLNGKPVFYIYERQ